MSIDVDRPSADTDILGVFDDPRYAALAVDNATKYQSADPFPHGVYDNFLPVDLAPDLSASIPDTGLDRMGVRGTTSTTGGCTSTTRRKCRRCTARMLREFNSRQFMLFLETLTGIDNLLPDPYFIGGGHPPQRSRRLPQDPCRLQLAPQAAGAPTGERVAVPVGHVGRSRGAAPSSSGTGT